MLRALLVRPGDVVYGSRYLGRGRHRDQSLAAYLGGRSLSVDRAGRLPGRYLTDTVTALKLFHRERLAAIAARDERLRAGSRDHGASWRSAARASSRCRSATSPRSREEGKKIGLRDWFIARSARFFATGTDDASAGRGWIC